MRKYFDWWNNITTSTTLAFTGAEFKATESGLYRVTATAYYSGAKPSQLELRKSDGNNESRFITVEQSNNSSLSTNILVGLGAGYSVKFYAKYETSATEQVGMVVERVH